MGCISIDLELPDHTQEIKDTEDFINQIKKEIRSIKTTRALSDKSFTSLYDRITRGLYYVGSLSEFAFNCEDIIQETYFTKYRHAPELAKKLWQEHYGQIHRPYNNLKNKLYRLYTELDELFLKINKCPPPNFS